MSFDTPVLNTSLASRRPDRHGKVRDIYDFGDRLLIVATDRISAFDYVLGTGIPDKGKVLTQISAFWFDRLKPVVDNHLISIDAADFPIDSDQERPLFAGRSMLVKRAEPLPIECVARGYLSGSGWKDYLVDRAGLRHPAALRPSRIRSPARADLHAGDEGADRPRHQHQRGRGRRARRSGRTRPGARSDDLPLRGRRRLCRIARHHRRRHQVRVRAAARRWPASRRASHPD